MPWNMAFKCTARFVSCGARKRFNIFLLLSLVGSQAPNKTLCWLKPVLVSILFQNVYIWSTTVGEFRRQFLRRHFEQRARVYVRSYYGGTCVFDRLRTHVSLRNVSDTVWVASDDFILLCLKNREYIREPLEFVRIRPIRLYIVSDWFQIQLRGNDEYCEFNVIMWSEMTFAQFVSNIITLAGTEISPTKSHFCKSSFIHGVFVHKAFQYRSQVSKSPDQEIILKMPAKFLRILPTQTSKLERYTP